MPQDTQSRRWCFTLFRTEPPTVTGPVRYGVWQLEVAPVTGREHWQGFVIFTQPIRFTAVKRYIGSNDCHVEVARGSSAQARDYCTKEETRKAGTHPIEVGDFPEAPGHRTDWDEFLAAVRANRTDFELILEFPSLFGRYPNGCRSIINVMRPLTERPVNFLFRWQDQLINELAGPVDPRKVIWYVDPVGSKGKSWLTQYLVRSLKADVYTGGRQADCAYACTGARIQVFDLSRERAEFFSYDFLEQTKNGLVFSTKYESGRKIFETPHVVVFSNWDPDHNKLSADRWDIRRTMDLTRVVPLIQQ